jgi:aspergillopepsin I
VFIDKVAIGSLVVPNQAVGAAKTASARLITDPGKDGILGLGFSMANSFKPKQQLSWFDNIRATLAAPLFTASLKRMAAGTYDFGFIDKSKYKGEIVWSPVKQPNSYWGVKPTGFAIGNGPVENFTFSGIADTGSSLMYLPTKVVQKYWGSVKGARTGYSGDWQFPCDAKLPDLSIIISDKPVTVPGINMKYMGVAVGGGYCHGGLQSELKNLRFSILGAVFHKGVFVVYEAPIGRQPRLGFAQRT